VRKIIRRGCIVTGGDRRRQRGIIENLVARQMRLLGEGGDPVQHPSLLGEIGKRQHQHTRILRQADDRHRGGLESKNIRLVQQRHGKLARWRLEAGGRRLGGARRRKQGFGWRGPGYWLRRWPCGNQPSDRCRDNDAQSRRPTCPAKQLSRPAFAVSGCPNDADGIVESGFFHLRPPHSDPSLEG